MLAILTMENICNVEAEPKEFFDVLNSEFYPYGWCQVLYNFLWIMLRALSAGTNVKYAIMS